jgi:hypothetical protein
MTDMNKRLVALLAEKLAGCAAIESGGNGRGGMRVVVHFSEPRQELGLFHLLGNALHHRES